MSHDVSRYLENVLITTKVRDGLCLAPQGFMPRVLEIEEHPVDGNPFQAIVHAMRPSFAIRSQSAEWRKSDSYVKYA